MSDPHVMGDGMAPTPFTADEIRHGCPDGHTLRVRTVEGESETVVLHRFDHGDADGVTLTWLTDNGERSARVTWRDLQEHASFPADRTTITNETIETELGERECLRYDLSGEAEMTFWFAVDHPGMPVRHTDGTSTTDVVGIERT